MRDGMKQWLKRSILIILSLLFLFPLLLTIVLSFNEQAVLNDSVILSNERMLIGLQGYYDLLVENYPLMRNFWNSVFYSVVICGANLIIGVPAAFAMTQIRYKWKNVILLLLIILLMMPLQVTLLPNYIGLRDMGLLNTIWAIILPAVFTPFSVVILVQYMTNMQSDEIEAALLETKSVIAILIKICLPQLKPCVLATLVFVFSENWNMVEQPHIYLKNDLLKPLSSFLTINSGYSLCMLFAGAVIYMMPIIILYLYFHDSLHEGMAVLKQ